MAKKNTQAISKKDNGLLVWYRRHIYGVSEFYSRGEKMVLLVWTCNHLPKKRVVAVPTGSVLRVATKKELEAHNTVRHG